MEVAQIPDRVVARFIGTKHERDVKRIQPLVAAINAREAETQALSDAELKTRFAELRQQVQAQLGEFLKNQKAQAELVKIVDQLRSQAKIVAYIDSGTPSGDAPKP